MFSFIIVAVVTAIETITKDMGLVVVPIVGEAGKQLSIWLPSHPMELKSLAVTSGSMAAKEADYPDLLRIKHRVS